MTGKVEISGEQRRSRWRIPAWAFAGLVVLLPLVAMQFTDRVDWNVTDFALAGALIVLVGLAFEPATRVTSNNAY